MASCLEGMCAIGVFAAAYVVAELDNKKEKKMDKTVVNIEK